LIYILPIILVILRYVYFFKFAGGFTGLSNEFSVCYQFHVNSAKDVGKYIKVSMTTELLYIVLSPLLFFLLLFLPIILLIAIILLPFIFLTLGFKALSPTFKELKRLNLYFDQFTNWLLYSRYIMVVSVFSSLYGTFRFIEAIVEGFLTGYFDVSFLLWFLIAAITALLGYICFVGGFFCLSNNVMKIRLTQISTFSQNGLGSRISPITPKLDQSKKEEVVYAYDGSLIAFKENINHENPNNMILEVRDTQIDRANPLNTSMATTINQPVVKYCPRCEQETTLILDFAIIAEHLLAIKN